MGNIKTLETERLILRKLDESDAEEMYKNWASDDEVTKYVRWSTHKNIDETKKYIKFENEQCKGDNYYNWGIVLKETGANKIAVIKVIREVTGLGLKEAKEIADGAPKTIKEGVAKEEAEELKAKFEEAGATITLK